MSHLQTSYLQQIEDLNQQNFILSNHINTLQAQVQCLDSATDQKVTDLTHFFEEKLYNEKQRRKRQQREKKQQMAKFKEELVKLTAKVTEYEGIFEHKQSSEIQLRENNETLQHQVSQQEQIIQEMSGQIDREIAKFQDLHASLQREKQINKKLSVANQGLKEDFDRIKALEIKFN